MSLGLAQYSWGGTGQGGRATVCMPMCGMHNHHKHFNSKSYNFIWIIIPCSENVYRVYQEIIANVKTVQVRKTFALLASTTETLKQIIVAHIYTNVLSNYITILYCSYIFYIHCAYSLYLPLGCCTPSGVLRHIASVDGRLAEPSHSPG